MTHPNSTTALPCPQPASSRIKRRLSRKERFRIHDALQNLDNELSGASALSLLLWEKANYCINMCEDLGFMLDRAEDERLKLYQALNSEKSE